MIECIFSIFDFSIWEEIMAPQNFQNSIARKSEIGHKFLKFSQNCFIFGYIVDFQPLNEIIISGI